MSDSVKDFVAGTMGGFTAKLLDYPFDTVKVLLQTQNSSGNSGGVVVYRNAWHCFKHTVETKGVAGLYKGLSSPLLGCMAENALLFWAYSHTKRFAVMATTSASSSSSANGNNNSNDGEKKDDLTLFQLSLAGAAAGAVVPLVLTPIELIKCRLQVQNSFGRAYTGPLDVLWDVLKNEGGIRGLYKGNVSTLLREVPGNFVWYGCYEGTCMYFTPENGTKKDLKPWVHLLGGALAGVGYWTACYPLDTVKSRLQTRGGGLMETTLEIWRAEGMRGLFRGWGITVLRAAPAHALIFAVYEQTLKFLNGDPERTLARRTSLRD